MTDEDALNELSKLFPERTFTIRHGEDGKVGIYRGAIPYTVRDTLEECVETARWYASYLKGGPKTLREYRESLAVR